MLDTKPSLLSQVYDLIKANTARCDRKAEGLLNKGQEQVNKSGTSASMHESCRFEQEDKNHALPDSRV